MPLRNVTNVVSHVSGVAGRGSCIGDPTGIFHGSGGSIVDRDEMIEIRVGTAAPPQPVQCSSQ